MTNKKNKEQKITTINPGAAGIDIGSREHYVCVPAIRDKQNIRKFSAFTSDLKEMATWLKKCGIKTIAMESTGIYWIPVFQVLETSGFEVKLVNARHVKNVPGRKTDILDCQWIQQLHSFGLLNGSFRPNDQICELRTCVRQRERIIKSAARHVNRMQKALNEMNIQLHHVITNITGVTGMKIIKAIVDGERDAQKLAEFRDTRIRSNSQTIIKALEGDYRREHLLVLKQELESYEFYQKQIAECDKVIEGLYEGFDKQNTDELSNNKKKKNKNTPNFNARKSLYNIAGVDFTIIPGLNEASVQTIISEVGLDMSKWPTEQHFASWLGLCPNNKITGGKVFSTKTRKVINKASNAFRLAVLSASKGQSAIAGFFKRLKGRLGGPKAITATARKLACMFYRLLKYGQSYVEQGIEAYDKKYNETRIKNLKNARQN